MYVPVLASTVLVLYTRTFYLYCTHTVLSTEYTHGPLMQWPYLLVPYEYRTSTRTVGHLYWPVLEYPYCNRTYQNLYERMEQAGLV